MDAAERKALFRKLAAGHDLDDLAVCLGMSVDTLCGWRKRSNPRAPSEVMLQRLRQIVVTDLTERIRSLALDVVPRNSAPDQSERDPTISIHQAA
jgi:hypothetical protein